ncbi:MAG TPA: HAMP domain-containing sensor histidine kinase [Candidatus Eremiobacteraceae bacterium]|nr:HAMP domain-containing sensor histidine kinase [Candidatus Eremiobacteraceae bacterium]
MRALEPALRALASRRRAAPLLYVELDGIGALAGASTRTIRSACKRAVAATLRSAAGHLLRRRDVVVAGPRGSWFAALLLDRAAAAARRSTMSDADLGVVAGRVRAAVQSALDDVRRKRALPQRVVARAGWTVIEPRDASRPLLELRHALRGAAVVARVEERRATILAAITHELRTPLTSIIGYAEALLGAAKLDDARRKRSLVVLGEEARRLHRLVEGLIDFGAWNAGRLTLRASRVELREIARRGAATVASQAAHRGVRIVIRGEGVALVDADRMLQVLVNLLDNAVRHARAGGRVELRIAGNSSDARIVVIDDGSGFDPAIATCLGSAFAIGPGGRVGLGLALSRAVVAAHGGTMSARSPRTGGARVEIVVPRATGEKP